MGARFLYWRLDMLFTQWFPFLNETVTTISPGQYLGYPVFLQKPFHVVLLSLTGLFTGLKPWMVIAHSITYSLGAIALTVWLGLRYLGRTAAVLTGLWLAVEPFHVHYSRTGLHEMDAMFLLMAGIVLWFSSLRQFQKWKLFLLGLVLMFCIGTSYRMVLLVFIVIISDVFLGWLDKRPVSEILKRIVWISVGMGVSFSILNLAYFLAFYPEFTWSQPGSYVDLLKMKFGATRESSFCLDFPLFYLKIFCSFDGLISLIVSLVSVIYALVFGSRYVRIIGSLFLFQFLFLSLMSPHLARAPTAVLPLAAFAVGFTVSHSVSHFYKNKRIISISICLLFSTTWIAMIINLKPIYSVRSGYHQVIQFLDSKSQTVHLTTMKPIYAAYRNRTYALDPGATLMDLKRQMEETGAQYLTVDWQKYLRYQKSVMKIEETVLPVFAAVNPVGDFFATLHENHLPPDVPILRDIDRTLGYIKVYDLKTALPACGIPLHQETVDGRSEKGS